MKKHDRRVNRTRRALQEALQELIHEKSYEAVTIEEITERANLGRTTFYLHYRDKEDLLLEGFSELVDDLFEELAHYPLTAWMAVYGDSSPSDGADERPGKPSLATPIRLIFRHAQDNAELYRLVLRGEGLHRVSARLHDFINTAVQAFLHMKADAEGMRIETRVPLEVFSNYFASALIGTVTWWLENDMPYPVEEMAQVFEQLFLPGAKQVIQIQKKTG